MNTRMTMDCGFWREQLDVYVDGELPAPEAEALQAHLAACAGCSAEALSRVRLKRAVHSTGRKYEASVALRRRVAASMPARASRRFTWSQLWATSGLAAAAAVLIVVTLGGLGRRPQSDAALQQLTDQHVAMLASPNPLDVVSSDKHTVKPWFQGRVPFTFALPELQGTPFELLGGRVVYLEQTPGAQLVFGYRQHHVSVYIFQADSKAGAQLSRSSGTGRREGFTTESWDAGGLRYVAVGDPEPAAVEQLCQLLQRAAK